MANSPRPGVIQLEHPNIYQAAKQAQQDDQLRQFLKITGDTIAKRNEDIRYNKAMGKKEDRWTTEDLVKKGAPLAWEGIKSGAGAAWDILKAPFTEDVVTEKSYEEGVKTERPLFQGEMSQEDPFSGGMSREQTMSLAESEPSDAVAVSFPTTVVGKDRVVEPSRREVGGKVDWDFPNKGYKTEFPTTVVGAPSTLKAPSAQPVGQKAPETPQNDADATNDKVPEGMLQAPDYSEMYRLNPNRATFDYTREKNAEVLAQKAEAAMARMELMQAKMEAKANAGSSLEELQQLWKENQRALVQARKDQDKSSTKMYEDNIARLLPILQEKAPSVWGTPPKKKDEVPPPEVPGGSGEPTPKQSALKEAYSQVDLLVDDNENGILDNLKTVDREIKAIRDKYGVSDSDMQDVYSQIELVKTQAKAEKTVRDEGAQRALENKLKNEAANRSTGAQDERAALLRIDKINKDPSPQNKSDAILWVMRKRSGAKIDPNEFLQYIKGGVDYKTYAEISKDLSPAGIAVWLGELVGGKLSEAQVSKITDKYAERVNPSFLTQDLGTFVDPSKIKSDKAPPPPSGGKKDPLGIR